MTSPTIDYGGIELVVSADVDVISDTEWKEFACNMHISDFKSIQHLARTCNPKLLRRLFSSNLGTQNLHLAARLGKTDVMKVLLHLERTDVNKIDYNGRTALHHAAGEGHLDIVSMLLAKENINVNLLDQKGNTALHYAAEHGNVLVFDKILRASKVDVNSTNKDGKTPLILAAGGGNEEVVDKLLKKPDVLVTLEDDNNTPLHAAAEYGHAVIVEMLLGKVDVNSTNHFFRQSPLHLAIEGGHENVVDLLLKASTVNPSLKDFDGNTPLHIAAKAGNGLIFEKLLQMPEVDVNSANYFEEMTALHLATKNKHANIITMLLEDSNVDPCVKMRNDKTPLHMAAMSGGTDVVKVLLTTGKVDVNITDSKKRTAIHCAAKRGHLNVVELLLGEANVTPSIGDENDDTPLHLAAKLGHRGIVERLLAVPHVDVNKVNKQNETPLFLALRYGFVNVVDLFLENPKVDLSICDEHGDSPFHIAVKGNHDNIAEKLITPPRVIPIHANKENVTALHLCLKGGHQKLVDILLKQSTLDASTKDVCGNFPIHYAAQNGNICIFQKILNAPGVDVNSINDRQDTALHIAARTGHVDVVDLLLQVPTLDANLQDRNGNSALHVAAKYGEEEIIENLLKADRVDVNAKGKGGATALDLAIEEGHVRVVDKLLGVQDLINSQGVLVVEESEAFQNNRGAFSLLVASRNGHDTIIKSLLAHGVDVNRTQELFYTSALNTANEYGHPKAVEVLLNDPNIDPNKIKEDEEHPLFLAAIDGQNAIVEKLMATGQIDVNVLSHGRTALQGAAASGKEQVVKILLNTPGINVYIRNEDGETALFDAARANNKTILKDIYNASKVNVESEECIVQVQSIINDVNNNGDSIIHLAARENFLNVIDFLFEVVHEDARSVDVNLKTSPPKEKEHYPPFTPQLAVQIASDEDHYVVVEKLTKFDGINFIQEEKNGMTVLQRIFDQNQRVTFNILRRTPEVTNYIDALYKDRQASVDAANAILVGAALIASVTFASWLQPPLGYATYYHEQFLDTLPAPPVAYPEYVAFDHHPSLQAFWVFNSLSFFSAIATVISGARSVLPTKPIFIKQEVANLRRNLLKTSILLGFSMFFVLLAFATAGVIVLPPVMKFRANIFSTIVIGGIVCFVFLFLFGKNIFILSFDIKSSQASKIGFTKEWPFIRNKDSKDKDST